MANFKSLQRILVAGSVTTCLLLMPKLAMANMNGANFDDLVPILLTALFIIIISFVNLILSLVNTTKKSGKMRIANMIMALPMFIVSFILFANVPKLALFCLGVTFFNALIIFFSYSRKQHDQTSI